MDREPDEQLKTQFLSLLLKADPAVAKRQALAEEFAGRLAGFTESWAAGAPDLGEQEEAIREWIDSNPAAKAAAARPKAMAVGAGAGGSRGRRRPAKKR